jgi:hypothetical protein
MPAPAEEQARSLAGLVPAWGRPFVAARLDDVLESGVVDLIGDALTGVAGRLRARLKAPGGCDRRPLTRCAAASSASVTREDQLDVDRVGPVAATTPDAHPGETVAGAGLRSSTSQVRRRCR